MPVGHPLFLFSVGERTTNASAIQEHIWLSAVRNVAAMKWSYLLMDWDETRVNWS